MATDSEDIATTISAATDELAAITTDIVPHSVEGESFPITKRQALADAIKALRSAQATLDGGYTVYSEVST